MKQKEISCDNMNVSQPTPVEPPGKIGGQDDVIVSIASFFRESSRTYIIITFIIGYEMQHSNLCEKRKKQKS